MTTFNQDWLGWSDAPGGSDRMTEEEELELLQYWVMRQEDEKAQDADAAWYRFCAQ